MRIKQENRSCRYEAGMVCFYNATCDFPSLVSCLQQNLYLAQKEISLLKEKRNLKHDKVSLKWRNNAFYFKKKNRYLEDWIKGKGMEVPTTEEIFPKDPPINLESKNTTNEGETNERVRGDNSAGIQ